MIKKFLTLFTSCVFLFSCASTGSLQGNKQKSDDAIAQMDKIGKIGEIDKIDKIGESTKNTPKEIIGSAEDGTVLHKDVIHQEAKPGDYITMFKGQKQNQPVKLNQGDINFSKAEVERMNKELLDVKPGSVRDLLTEIVDEQDFELQGAPTPAEEVDYDQIKGRVVEFISDIRKGKQIILIATNKSNKSYFNSKYHNPPWLKSSNKVPPNLIAFTLAKNIDDNKRNEVFSFSEDVEGTKKMLKQVKEVSKPPPPKAPRKPVIKPFLNDLAALMEFKKFYGDLGFNVGVYSATPIKTEDHKYTDGYYTDEYDEYDEKVKIDLNPYCGLGLGRLILEGGLVFTDHGEKNDFRNILFDTNLAIMLAKNKNFKFNNRAYLALGGGFSAPNGISYVLLRGQWCQWLSWSNLVGLYTLLLHMNRVELRLAWDNDLNICLGFVWGIAF
jgi:hypothetical protein